MRSPIPHLASDAGWRRRCCRAAATLSIISGFAASPATVVALEPAPTPTATSAAVATPPVPAPSDLRLGGAEESARELRFVFVGTSNPSDAQLFGVYLDPRMR